MRLLVPALLVFSFNAFSCPNLVGKYATCISQTGQMDPPKGLEISQSEARGVSTYLVSETDASGERTTETYKADGRTYTQTTNEGGAVLTQLTSTVCMNDQVVIIQKIFSGNQEIASLQSTVSKNGNELVQTISGNVMETNVEDTFSCQ